MAKNEEDNFFARRKRELNAELSELNRTSKVKGASTISLAKFLSQFRTYKDSELLKSDSKSGGVTEGYQAKDSEQHLYQIKTLKKLDPSNMGERDLMNYSMFIAEFLTAPIYKDLLAEHAPEIALVKKGELAKFSSKFLDGWQSLIDFEKKHRNSKVKPEILGYDEVMSTCLFLGEKDAHGENIGGVNKGTLEKPEYHVAKIDHGRSLSTITETDLNKATDSALAKFEYQFWKKGHESLKLDREKFAHHVKKISSLNPSHLNRQLNSRINMLKAEGFKFCAESEVGFYKDVSISEQKKNEYRTEYPILTADQYKENLQTRHKIMGVLDDRLEFLRLIEQHNNISFDENWLQQISNDSFRSLIQREDLKIADQPLNEYIKANKLEFYCAEYKQEFYHGSPKEELGFELGLPGQARGSIDDDFFPADYDGLTSPVSPPAEMPNTPKEELDLEMPSAPVKAKPKELEEELRMEMPSSPKIKPRRLSYREASDIVDPEGAEVFSPATEPKSKDLQPNTALELEERLPDSVKGQIKELAMNLKGVSDEGKAAPTKPPGGIKRRRPKLTLKI